MSGMDIKDFGVKACSQCPYNSRKRYGIQSEYCAWRGEEAVIPADEAERIPVGCPLRDGPIVDEFAGTVVEKKED